MPVSAVEPMFRSKQYLHRQMLFDFQSFDEAAAIIPVLQSLPAFALSFLLNFATYPAPE